MGPAPTSTGGRQGERPGSGLPAGPGAPGPGASAAQLTAWLIGLSQQPLGLPLLIQLGEGNARILLLEQDPIDGNRFAEDCVYDTLQALLDGGEHLLLQEGDLLLPVGMLNPGAAGFARQNVACRPRASGCASRS